MKNHVFTRFATSFVRGGFVPVKGVIVAADNDTPQGTADQIEALRRVLEGGGGILVNSDGTVYNPADGATESSLAASGGYKPVKPAVVAAPEQWYMKNPALKRAEIAAMADIKPEATCGFRADGKMYWIINLNPVVCGKRCRWTLLAVYDDDHPKKCWGGSVKFYPVKPNIQEMHAMVARSHVTPEIIPCLLRDEQGQLWICYQSCDILIRAIRTWINRGNDVNQDIDTIIRTTLEQEGLGVNRDDGAMYTAASCLSSIMQWIILFELGLMDQRKWSVFSGTGYGGPI